MNIRVGFTLRWLVCADRDRLIYSARVSYDAIVSAYANDQSVRPVVSTPVASCDMFSDNYKTARNSTPIRPQSHAQCSIGSIVRIHCLGSSPEIEDWRLCIHPQSTHLMNPITIFIAHSNRCRVVYWLSRPRWYHVIKSRRLRLHDPHGGARNARSIGNELINCLFLFFFFFFFL